MGVETSSDRDFACFICIEGKGSDLEEDCPKCGAPLSACTYLQGAEFRGFTLTKYVNRGYYGATFQATNRIGKSFAVKLVPTDLYELNDKSFSEEISRYSKLGRHPNIAELFDAGQVSLMIGDHEVDFHFIVMEWIDGVPLTSFIAHNPITASMLYGAGLDLASALARFTECNLWHNDLNAQNILVKQLSDDELQTRRSESPYTLKIVDTGSAVFRQAFGHKRLDDITFLGRHLNSLKEAAERNPHLSREDRFFLSTTKTLIARLLDEDPARRLDDSRQAAIELTALYQARLSLLFSRDVKLSSPFDYLNANDFPSPAYINALFSSGFPWIPEIADAAAQSLLITGPRGSGKTMILRSMRLRTRLDGETPNDRQRFDYTIAQSDYVAFFTSARLEIGNHILTTKLPAWVEREEVVVAYFHLLYLFEIIETLQYAVLHCGLELDGVGERTFTSLLSIALASQVLGLGSALEAIRAFQARIIDEPEAVDIPVTLSDGIFLSRLCSALAKAVPSFQNKSIVFLLDDFSLPKIPEVVQRVLLPIIWNSGGGYSFRVSAHSESVEYTDTRGNVYQANRDFREISLGAQYIVSLGDAKRRAMVDSSVTEMFAKRAKLSGKPWLDVKTLVGPGSTEDIAAEIRRRASDKSLRAMRYHGWSALLDLCSGDVSYIIDVIGQMMASQTADTTSIPIDEQSQFIRQYGRRELVRLQDHSSSVANLYDVALNFGKISLFKLQREDRPNGPGSRPAEYLRIEVDLGKSSLDAQNLISELLRSGVFIDGGISASSGGNPARRLVFRKLFTPAFPTTFRNRDTFAWRSPRFLEFVHNPSAFLRGMMAEEGIGPEQQQLELDDLFNPGE